MILTRKVSFPVYSQISTIRERLKSLVVGLIHGKPIFIRHIFPSVGVNYYVTLSVYITIPDQNHTTSDILHWFLYFLQWKVKKDQKTYPLGYSLQHYTWLVTTVVTKFVCCAPFEVSASFEYETTASGLLTHLAYIERSFAYCINPLQYNSQPHLIFYFW